MKTNEEITAWIDSKEVLTKKELGNFVYSNPKMARKANDNRLNRFWDYVLKTKDLGKLKEYQQKKINNGCRNEKRYNEIINILKSDKRFYEVGNRLGTKILLNVYNIKLQRYLFTKYKKEALC